MNKFCLILGIIIILFSICIYLLPIQNTATSFKIINCNSNEVLARPYCPPSPICDAIPKCIDKGKLTNGCWLTYDSRGNSQKYCNNEKIIISILLIR